MFHKYVSLTEGYTIAIYGYIRVSTKDKQENSLTNQRHLLYTAGATKYFEDKMSGKNADRPELKRLLQTVQENDTVIVTKIDRLARSLKDLIEIVEGFHNKGVSLHVLNFGTIDNSPIGKLMINMLGAVAEFERELINERVKEGVNKAKEQGKYSSNSRPRLYKDTDSKLLHAFELYDNGQTVSYITEVTGIKRNTFYRRLAERNINSNEGKR